MVNIAYISYIMNIYIYSPTPRGMPPSWIWQRPRIPYSNTLSAGQGPYIMI